MVTRDARRISSMLTAFSCDVCLSNLRVVIENFLLNWIALHLHLLSPTSVRTSLRHLQVTEELLRGKGSPSTRISMTCWYLILWDFIKLFKVGDDCLDVDAAGAACRVLEYSTGCEEIHLRL